MSLEWALWRFPVARRRRHQCPRFRIKPDSLHRPSRVPGCPVRPTLDLHQCRLSGLAPRGAQMSGRGLAPLDKDFPGCLADHRLMDRWGTRIPQAGTCALRWFRLCCATQPSISPANWFIWFLWSIWLVWFNQTRQTKQTRATR